METTSPGQKETMSPETLEKKIEKWVEILGERSEETYFYGLLDRWLKDVCQNVRIWLDENPYISLTKVYGTDYVRHGRAHYINEIVCDNNVYELDVEYTIYEFTDSNAYEKTIVIDRIDRVKVRKIEELAGE